MKDGEVLSDRYRVICRIGRGGTSTVYKVEDRFLHKTWALKIFLDEDSYGEIFEREVRLLCRLNHPGLPRVADVIQTKEGRGIVMDLLEGDTLDHLKGPRGYEFSETQVLKWGCQLCDILDYLHRQDPPVIYGDLKPANILLRPDGNIMLLDLGISRSMITPFYAAPEQLDRSRPLTPQTDLYGLGQTLHVLLDGRSTSQKASLEELIGHLTDPAPMKRGQSAAEVRFAIQNILNEGFAGPEKKKQSFPFKKSLPLLILILPALIIGAVHFTDFNQNQKKKAAVAQNGADSSEPSENGPDETKASESDQKRRKVLQRKIAALLNEPLEKRNFKALALYLSQWRQTFEIRDSGSDRMTPEESCREAREERKCAEYYLTYADELMNEARIPETEAEGLLLDAEKHLNDAENGNTNVSARLISKEKEAVLSLLLNLYQRVGRTERALNVADKLLRLKQRSGGPGAQEGETDSDADKAACPLKELHLIRLNLLIESDRHDEAYRELEKLIQSYPKELKGYLSMMSYDYRTGRLDEAVKLYHLAEKQGDVSKNPDFQAMKTKLRNAGVM